MTFWHSAEYGSDFRCNSGEIPRNSAEFRGISPELRRNHFRSQKIPRNSVSAEFRGHPSRLWMCTGYPFNRHQFCRRAGCIPQSRQSAKRFSSRWNWDSPTPLAAGECAPRTLWSGGGGGGHTRLRLKGWGSPNSNEGTYTVVLYIYKYFVVYPLQPPAVWTCLVCPFPPRAV